PARRRAEQPDCRAWLNSADFPSTKAKCLEGDGEELRLRRVLLVFLSGLWLAPLTVVAQDYPSRPVTLVVPFAPGGGVDQMARLIAGKLEQRLGKSFIIENKAGAGSIIAA